MVWLIGLAVVGSLFWLGGWVLRRIVGDPDDALMIERQPLNPTPPTPSPRPVPPHPPRP